MISYEKLMKHDPTVYETIVNSKGQSIVLVEHPTKGDEEQVICVCHELKLADYSGFYDTEDMTQEDSDYQPNFQDNQLYIGDFKA